MKWILFALSFIGPQGLLAQQFHFETYSTNNGLVNNEIRTITQDPTGFLYFGTPTGLSRYDGSRFTNYTYKNGFQHSLILDVESVDSTLLFFPVSRYYYKINKGRLLKDSTNIKTIIKNIYRQNDGTWLACSDNGLYRFEKGKLTLLPLYPDSIKMPLVNFVQEWQDSLLVVGRGNLPLDIFNKKSWKKVASSKKLFVRALCKDAMNNIWIATIDDGIKLLTASSIVNGEIKFNTLPRAFDPFHETEFRAISQDQDGQLWFGSVSKGLIRYHPKTGDFQHISTNNGLSSNTVYSLFTDKENNLWIGTNNGIQKLVSKQMLSFSSKHGLPSDLILDLVQLNDQRIVTTGYSGLGLIENNSVSASSNSLIIGNNDILQFDTLNGQLWAITVDELIRIGIERQQFILKEKILLEGRCKTLHPVYGGLLVGGDSAIWYYNNGRKYKLASDPHLLIRAMSIKGDTLWTVNTNNLLKVYQLLQNQEGLSLLPLFEHADQGFNTAQCLFVANDQTVCIGTRLNGLYILKRNKNGWTERQLKVQDGLSDNNIRSLCLYKQKTLLVGTGNGLDQLDLTEKEKPAILNVNNWFGFSTTVYSISKASDQLIWLGTETGLIKLPMAELSQRATKLSPIVTQFSLLNQPDSIFDLRNLQLLPDQNSFTVYFTCPSYVNEKTISYSYWLKGSEQKDWTQPGKIGSISFAGLAPGKYELLVKAIDFSGVESKQIASLSIQIQPPFWRRAWFLVSSLVLLFLAAYFIVVSRIRFIKKQASIRQRMAEAETMALRAQMNPHFIFNCISSIDNFIQDNDKENASAWLNKFAKLIRNILDNSKNEVIPFWKDWETIKLYLELEQLRNDNSFQYSLIADPELTSGHYKIPPLIAQPYIENAIHHGLKHRNDHNGRLLITAKLIGNSLHYYIEDNGIGITKAKEINATNRFTHQSYGLQLSADRINLFNEKDVNAVELTELKDKEGSVTGTLVSIVLIV